MSVGKEAATSSYFSAADQRYRLILFLFLVKGLHLHMYSVCVKVHTAILPYFLTCNHLQQL